MLKNFSIDKNMAKLILFQKVELLSSFQKKLEKYLVDIFLRTL